MAFDVVCGKKMEVRSEGNTWWWSEIVKGVVSRKKERSTQGNVSKQY